ncbi:MAG: hypothetical protein IPI49_18900 [Myxococcales bacterium]|jgi:hypothetical protein|nr:hypothetical protein [Myxococcales bacterium]HRC56660.1 hypothetical protein [Kofleriaceae bacterium]
MSSRWVSLLVLALATAVSLPALAEESVECSFLEIRASSTDSPSLAAELRPLEKKLKRPPFSSWNTFELLSSVKTTLPLIKAQTLKLTYGQATVLYRESTESKKKRRMALTVVMDDQDGKRVIDIKFNVEADDYFAVGRSLSGKNGHVLALTCH